MQAALNALLPILIVIAVGFGVRKGNWLSDSAFRGLGWLVFWIGLPAFLFVRIAQMEVIDPAAWLVCNVLTCVMLFSILLAYFLGPLLRLNRQQFGVFVQAAFRGNLAFVGWPVLESALASAFPDRAEPLMDMAILAVAPLIALYNVGSVLVLLPGMAAAETRGQMVYKSVKGIVTNPLIIACLGGLAWQALGWPIPLAAEKTLMMLAGMSLPAALLVVGGAMGAAKIRGAIIHGTMASLLRVAAGPMLAFVICMWAGFPPEWTLICVLYMACPTAVASHVIAEQMGGDIKLSSNAVVISTLLSMIAIAVSIIVLVR